MTERDWYDDSDYRDAVRRAGRTTRCAWWAIGGVAGLLGVALIALIAVLAAVCLVIAFGMVAVAD
ncbi:hypothetical protein ABZ614_28495 [Streptomyces sp. NPDC013178]|uniref:hypothetical protein n=1 Tax=unclassified Streptomyces TaxID=2593676 RepID=UPI0033F3FAA9